MRFYSEYVCFVYFPQAKDENVRESLDDVLEMEYNKDNNELRRDSS